MINAFKNLLFCLDAENAHRLALATAKILQKSNERMKHWEEKYRIDQFGEFQIKDLVFKNPIGLAAGFDKQAEIVNILYALGFGFIELGSVTPLAQLGNPRPRLFRDRKSKTILNRMGFNSCGMEVFKSNLLNALRTEFVKCPVGINFGKNKLTEDGDAHLDYGKLAQCFQDLGDYFVVNVSSPNTPGLRSLQETESLKKILDCINKYNSTKPVFLKLSPDMEHKEFVEVVNSAEDLGYNGLILCNTTLDRSSVSWSASLGAGGISGKALTLKSRELLLHARPRTKLPIISVGGIDSAEEVLWRLERGAQLVQVYSALVFNGPFWINELLIALKAQNFNWNKMQSMVRTVHLL